MQPLHRANDALQSKPLSSRERRGARVIRQFHEGTETVTLAKVLVLPDVPTMGTRLDLRAEGVEAALTVVGVTLRPIPDGPGVRPTSVEVVLHWESTDRIEAARLTP